MAKTDKDRLGDAELEAFFAAGRAAAPELVARCDRYAHPGDRWGRRRTRGTVMHRCWCPPQGSSIDVSIGERSLRNVYHVST